MFKVIVSKGMLMATWKHEMSILMSEQTQKVKKLFRKKKKIVSSRDHQIFSSLHTQRGHFHLLSYMFIFAVMWFICEKGKGLKNQ